MTTQLTEQIEEIPISEKILLHLKHDSNCTVDRTGVCNCFVFPVANQLTELFHQEKQEIIKDVIENLITIRDVELKYLPIEKSRPAYNINVLINELRTKLEEMI